MRFRWILFSSLRYNGQCRIPRLEKYGTLVVVFTCQECGALRSRLSANLNWERSDHWSIWSLPCGGSCFTNPCTVVQLSSPLGKFKQKKSVWAPKTESHILFGCFHCNYWKFRTMVGQRCYALKTELDAPPSLNPSKACQRPEHETLERPYCLDLGREWVESVFLNFSERASDPLWRGGHLAYEQSMYTDNMSSAALPTDVIIVIFWYDANFFDVGK